MQSAVLAAVICQSFPLMLRRETIDYATNLVPRSFKTFDELSNSFVAYVLSSKKKRKTTIR